MTTSLTTASPAPVAARSIVARRLLASCIDIGGLLTIAILAGALGSSRCATTPAEYASGLPVCSGAGTLSVGSSTYELEGMGASEMWMVLALGLVALAVLTSRTGATPGKWLAGLRVQRTGGGLPSLGASLLRVLLGVLVDGAPYLAPIGGILQLRRTSGRQRHGDRIARTEVVLAS